MMLTSLSRPGVVSTVSKKRKARKQRHRDRPSVRLVLLRPASLDKTELRPSSTRVRRRTAFAPVDDRGRRCYVLPLLFYEYCFSF
jgi:hypothetical protein